MPLKVKSFSFALLVAGALCAPLLQKPVLASNIYTLGNFDGENVLATGDGPLYLGFTFSIADGFQATYDKIGVWLEDTTFADIRNTVYLYDITGITDGSAGRQIFAQNLVKDSTIPSTLCTVSDGTDRNDFCVGDASVQETLVANRTYALLASYKRVIFGDIVNDNLYTALNLNGAPGGNFSTIPNVEFGNPYFSVDNTTFTLGSSSFSYIGPNLGGFTVSSVGPTPGASVPAPLPMLGATAALAYSRKIKVRIKHSA